MDIILQSNLHFRMIQAKLTPALGALTQPMQEELNYAMGQDFPACEDEWVAIKPYYLILNLSPDLAKESLWAYLCAGAAHG